MNSPSSSALPRILFRNELPQDSVPIRDPDLGTKEVFHRKSGEDFSNRNNPKIYCAGDSAGVSSAPAGDSVVAAGASVAAGLVISVAAGGGVVGVVSGATVSVFCSHAARSAAPARMQMYFFIIRDAYCFNRSIAASAVFGPRRMLFEEQIARGQH